jgi:hypothetical protein
MAVMHLDDLDIVFVAESSDRGAHHLRDADTETHVGRPKHGDLGNVAQGGGRARGVEAGGPAHRSFARLTARRGVTAPAAEKSMATSAPKPTA